jgi:chromosome partitioning protein
MFNTYKNKNISDSENGSVIENVGSVNMIINFTHQKGGVGKSTLAINVAINLGADILDLDTLNACVLFNRIRKANGKDDLTVIQAETDQEALKIINEYKDISKTLVVDSGGYDSEVNRVALLSADVLITPVSPSQIEIFGLQNFIGILKDSSEQLNFTFMTNVIINNADVRSRSDVNKLKRFIANNSKYLDSFSTIVCSRVDFRRAYEMGLSVEELESDSKASNEIRLFCREIKLL